MKTMINEIIEKFQAQIEKIFESEGIISINEAEEVFRQPTNEFLRGIVQAYYEEIDEVVRLNKAGRKAAGLVLERKCDKRRVLTEFGGLEYCRSYYFNQKEERYEYPLDRVVGLEGYERISDGIGLELAAAACSNSYGNSSRFVTGNDISRQTVMNKIRKSEPEPEQITRRKVPFLHIDADEDHITLVGGKNTVVPLISVYEGIEKQGNRGICKNIFHISEYGKKTEDLWEQVLDELERRYELDGTKIYLHGDGASWVYKGLEWLPNARFVLDKYHRNQAIKAIAAGLDSSLKGTYTANLKQALLDGDCAAVGRITEKCIAQAPDREEKIRTAASYLIDFQEAIAITARDKEADNGGCTEPHVSHVLSRRLSSRPMAWSEKTLQAITPMLASGHKLHLVRKKQLDSIPLLTNAARAASETVLKATKNRYTAGLTDPDAAVTLSVIQNGKVTSLFKTLNSISDT